MSYSQNEMVGFKASNTIVAKKQSLNIVSTPTTQPGSAKRQDRNRKTDTKDKTDLMS